MLLVYKSSIRNKNQIVFVQKTKKGLVGRERTDYKGAGGTFGKR